MRKALFWTLIFVLSIAGLAIASPILLFVVGPYVGVSVFGFALYVAAVAVLSFLSFTAYNRIAKRLLFGVLLIPVVMLAALLISIGAGWLHFPNC
jgi:hypothetical protein